MRLNCAIRGGKRNGWTILFHAVWLPLLMVGVLLWGGASRQAVAGGGPENVLLVVNSRSAASMTIANYFIEIRHIPPRNVVYLDWRGDLAKINVDSLRKDIFAPIITQMNSRGLAPQIDYIVYSSDFPWSIDFLSDVPEALCDG